MNSCEVLNVLRPSMRASILALGTKRQGGRAFIRSSLPVNADSCLPVQLLHAHKDIGGTTIVIVTEVPKLELEEWFRCVFLSTAQSWCIRFTLPLHVYKLLYSLQFVDVCERATHVLQVLAS